MHMVLMTFRASGSVQGLLLRITPGTLVVFLVVQSGQLCSWTKSDTWDYFSDLLLVFNSYGKTF